MRSLGPAFNRVLDLGALIINTCQRETHRHLLEENFEELGEGPAGGCQVWIALMESARATKKHVVGGGRVFRDTGRRRGESTVYRRCFRN